MVIHCYMVVYTHSTYYISIKINFSTWATLHKCTSLPLATLMAAGELDCSTSLFYGLSAPRPGYSMSDELLKHCRHRRIDCSHSKSYTTSSFDARSGHQFKNQRVGGRLELDAINFTMALQLSLTIKYNIITFLTVVCASKNLCFFGFFFLLRENVKTYYIELNVDQ